MKQANTENSKEQFKQLFKNILNEASHEERTLLAEALKAQAGGDLVDQALGDRDQHIELKLQGRQGFFLKKVMTALEKIENGTFGLCEECDGDIGHARLLARPTATLCITCKEEEENSEQHIIYNKRSHTHGKGISASNSNVINLQFTDNSGDNKKGLSGVGRQLS